MPHLDATYEAMEVLLQAFRGTAFSDSHEKNDYGRVLGDDMQCKYNRLIVKADDNSDDVHKIKATKTNDDTYNGVFLAPIVEKCSVAKMPPIPGDDSDLKGSWAFSGDFGGCWLSLYKDGADNYYAAHEYSGTKGDGKLVQTRVVDDGLTRLGSIKSKAHMGDYGVILRLGSHWALATCVLTQDGKVMGKGQVVTDSSETKDI